MRYSMIKTIFAMFFVFAVCHTKVDAQSRVWFNQKPPTRNDVAANITISWQSDDPNTESRYKIDMPGDWMGGVKYAREKWSSWGDSGTGSWTIRYKDFINEGEYTFIVEARHKGERKTKRISTTFNVYFVMPEIFEEATKIDWAMVNAAPKKSIKYQLLANEYKKSYIMWMQVYERERRVLKLTGAGSGEKFIKVASSEVVGKGNGLLLAWANKGVSAHVSRILAPKLLYDIAKQGGASIILIYRNARANRAAFSALNAYWAWQGYNELARQERAKEEKANWKSTRQEHAKGGSTTNDISGTWRITEKDNPNNCGDELKTETYNAEFRIQGKKVTVIWGEEVFSGRLNENILTVEGSYREHRGITKFTDKITISGNSLSGISSWTWSNGRQTCSGTCIMTGRRI